MGQTTFSGPVRSLAGFITVGPDAVQNLTVSPMLLTVPENSGRLLRINNANAVIVLPPINVSPVQGPDTTNNLGAIFDLVIETAAVNLVIQATGLDKIQGSIVIQGGGGVISAFTAGAAINTITMNGGTQGGAPSSRVKLQAVAANKWLIIDSFLLGSGVSVTPFS